MLDDRYLEYSKNRKSIFYSEPNPLDKPEDRFAIYDFSTDHWMYVLDTDWIYMMNKDERDLPEQGWKIHLTAVPREAQELLYVVSKYLIENKISFKFVPTVTKLIDKNGKEANRASSGKFITVYPHDTKVFLKLLNDLNELTKLYTNGPYILNDKQWKNGNVFFRYGGFKQMTLYRNGEKIDAIKDPNGNLIPDQRVPYYYLPSFVKEPVEIQRENKAIPSSEYKELNKYKIKDAISFSDSGGVYKASIGDKPCILKEGRPKAGLDSKGTDGFYRILSEYRVLKILKDNPYVVNVNNYFTAWQHNYLEEEYVDGSTVDDIIVFQYPFNTEKYKPEKVNKYLETAIFISNELIKAIRSIHSQGIAIEDLQPSNIIYSEKKHRIKIIDFEEAENPKTPYEPGLMTFGFASKNLKTCEEADWFAVNKIIYYLFLPLEPSNSMFSPKIKEIYKERINLRFGEKAVRFLEKMDLELSRLTNIDGSPNFMDNFLTLPSEKLTRSNYKLFIKQLRNGIINNLDFESQGLIKGDIKQYKNNISRYSIGYGAFGGIMALLRTGGIPDEITDNLDNWLLKNYAILSSLNINEDAQYGLFDGIAGISSILYDLDEKEKATSLLKKIELDKVKNFSIYSGISGIGLAFLSGFSITNDNDLLKMSYKAASLVKNYFIRRIEKPVNKVDAGLLNGLSGEALFLYVFGEKTSNPDFKDIAIDMMDYVIKNILEYDQDGNLYVIDTSRKIRRAIPYLNDGSAGVAITMIYISKRNKDFLNNYRKKILNDLIKSTFCIATVEAGIREGFAGFLILGTFINQTFKDSKLMDYVLNGLNMYLFSNGVNEIYYPGSYAVKCSMDVSTGSSGLLLALESIKPEKQLAFLPLPVSAKIFKINNKDLDE